MALFRILSGSLFGRRNESGTAAIEFALFLPFLLLLLGGIVELGFSAYEAMQVSNAVDAGALYAAKNGWNSASIVSATVSGAASSGLTATPAPTQFCGCPNAAGSISNLGPPRALRRLAPVVRPALTFRSARPSITWSSSPRWASFPRAGACQPRLLRQRSSGRIEPWATA